MFEDFVVRMYVSWSWCTLYLLRMPGESYCRWLRSLSLCLHNVFLALNNSLVGWFWACVSTAPGYLVWCTTSLAILPMQLVLCHCNDKWRACLPCWLSFPGTGCECQSQSGTLVFASKSQPWVAGWHDCDVHAFRWLGAPGLGSWSVALFGGSVMNRPNSRVSKRRGSLFDYVRLKLTKS